jgi:hypothetical protein
MFPDTLPGKPVYLSLLMAAAFAGQTATPKADTQAAVNAPATTHEQADAVLRELQAIRAQHLPAAQARIH